MRVPVKLLGFVFWVFSYNFAQSQECRRENINYKNTEPVVQESYSDGETVELSCMIGFTGMYRLKCEKGEWKTSIARPCAKKRCSHPGVTANGDFKLTEGSEFVFGATVVYTCNKGFEMTSRISQRTCRSQGWDNTLPICEAVTCPAIRTDGDMTALGNTEEGSYGDVIHFECVSNDTKIDGSSDIHCTETGHWSHSVPKCKEITCIAPDISNGYVVEKMQEYQKDAILKYRCSSGFKPREGIPRCAKFGWTLNPECDEVTCELKLTSFGVKKIKPDGKTIFRAGERVEITCAETYLVLFTKENIKSFTCGENGQWDYQPVCEEIKCEVPRDQHVYWPERYFRGEEKLGENRSYSCISGYDQMSAEATCTPDGWTPNPLCAVMCAAPNIPNAEIVGDQRTKYIINSRIQYKCNPGFEPEQPVHITCTSQTEWTGIQQCTDGDAAATGNTEEGSYGDVIHFCVSNDKKIDGSSDIHCTETDELSDSVPKCKVITCTAPDISNGYVVEKMQEYQKDAILKYRCSPGFKPREGIPRCAKFGWTLNPECDEVTCELKSTTFGVKKIKPEGKTIFRAGEIVEITCAEKHWLYGTKENIKSFTCGENGQWDYQPVCEEVTCELKLTTFGVKKIKPEGKTIFRAGEIVEITCAETYWVLFTKENFKSFTCGENGQWDYEPVCEGKCGPPPQVDFAETSTEMTKPEYSSREKVEYLCFSKYTLDLSPPYSKYLTCEQGEWRGNIKCLKPCSVTVEEMDKRGIQLYWGGRQKIFSSHQDRLTFACQSGKSLIGSRDLLIQYCTDGEMYLPECV